MAMEDTGAHGSLPVTWEVVVKSILRDPARWIGLLVGLLGLILSFAYEAAIPGRLLGDPLPIMLGLRSLVNLLTSGLRYIDWTPPLAHLLFAFLLGAGAAVAGRLLLGRSFSDARAVRAAWTAGLVNVGAAAVVEVDSLLVGFFYVITGFASLALTSYFAGRAMAWLDRRAQAG